MLELKLRDKSVLKALVRRGPALHPTPQCSQPLHTRDTPCVCPNSNLVFQLSQAKLGDKMNSAVFDEREIKYIEGSSI